MQKKPIVFSFFMILAMFFFKGLPWVALHGNLNVATALSFVLKFLFAYFAYTKINSDNAKRITSQILGAMIALFVGAYLVKDIKLFSVFTYVVFEMGSSFLLLFILWAFLGQAYSLKSAITPYFLIIALALLVPTLELAILSARVHNHLLFFVLGMLSLAAALYALQKVDVDQGNDEGLVSKIDKIFWFKLSLFISFCAGSVLLINKAFRYTHETGVVAQWLQTHASYFYSKATMGTLFSFVLLASAFAFITKFRLKKILAICSYLLGGVTLIFVLLFYVQKENVQSYAFFSASISSIQAFLVFPLLQFFYLTLKKDLRYKAKAWVEVFFFLPVLGLLNLVPTIGLAFFPKVFGGNGHYFLVVPIVLVLALVCLARQINSEDKAS